MARAWALNVIANFSKAAIGDRIITGFIVVLGIILIMIVSNKDENGWDQTGSNKSDRRT